MSRIKRILVFLFLIMGAPALATADWSPNDVYKIENVGSGKVLDIADWFWENGGNLQQWDFADEDKQKWRIKSVAPGVYTIESVFNGRVIDVEQSADWNGANVHMWDYVGATNQQWQLWEVSSGIYKIQNQHSVKVLDVSERGTWNGANIQQWDYASDTNQQWRIIKLYGANESPIADAGGDVAFEVSSSAVLNGGNSYDPDNQPDPLSFSWQQIDGPVSVTLHDANTAGPSFVANEIGIYRFELTVSDGELMDTDVVTVTIIPGTNSGDDGTEVSSDFIITLPFGVPLEKAFFTTSESMLISYGVTANSEDATVSNMGPGKILIRSDAQLGGDLYAIGDVELEASAVVNGDAYVNGEVFAGNDNDVGTILGEIKKDQAKIGNVYDWTVYWQTSDEDIWLPVGSAPTEVVPGSYRNLNVQSGATIVLVGGTYYFDTVTIEAGASVNINSGGEPVVLLVRDSLISRGQYTHSTTAGDFLVAYAGQGIVDLDSPFSGTLVAPNGTIRLAPLNGGTHEGAFFGKKLLAEAHNNFVFTPFTHWDTVFGTDKCTSKTGIYNCSEIEVWEQKTYEEGDLVQDGALVYTVHTSNLAGADENHEPGVGNRWRESWSQRGYCSTLEDVNEWIGEYSSEKVHLYFPFDKIWEGQTERFVEDISGIKAVVHGNRAFILKNADRNGCHTFDALSLNVDYATMDSDQPEELSYVTVEKTTEEKSISVILPVKRLGVGASTILTNLSGTGSLFSIGYSEQRGVFVEIRDGGEVHVVESGVEEDLPKGIWTELAVTVEGLTDGTSKVRILKNGQSILSDSGEGVIVNGELDLSGGQWLLGAYKYNSQADVTEHFTGLMGPTLISDKLVPPQLSQGVFAEAAIQQLPSESASSSGTESEIRTAAPALPAPNPLSYVKTIKTPVANTRGTANVVYPIDVPKASIGPTPMLNLDYSSDRKKGNVGVGWRLHMSTIEIDTSDRGVPKYDSNSPISYLLLDGQKLKFWKTDSGSGDDLYRLVLESSFVTVRHVNKTDSNGGSFIAEYPDGRTDYYGSDASSRLADPNHSNRVFKWYIDRREDKDDNAIEYVWGTHQYTDSEAERWNSMTLEPRIEQIMYGRGRVIDFEWSGISEWGLGRDSDYESFKRFCGLGDCPHNEYTSGRGGFMVADPNLLYEITFMDPWGNVLKSIEANYASGAFGKYRLTSIEERNEAGEKINEHTFSYTEPGYEYPIDFDEEPIYLGEENRFFKPAEPWSPLTESAMVSLATGQEYPLDDELVTTTQTNLSVLDWNGDGVDDRVVYENYWAPLYTLGYGNHPNPSLIIKENNGEKFVNLQDLLDADPSCIYPFNVAGDGLRMALSLSQTHKYSGWSFERSGMYDMNGDGAKDFIVACNEKYIVVFGDNGEMEFGTDDIVEYPSTRLDIPDTYLSLLDYDWDVDGRIDDNEFIEEYSLKSVHSYRRYVLDSDLTTDLEEVNRYVNSKFLDINGDGWLDRLVAYPEDGFFNSEIGWTNGNIMAFFNNGPVEGFDANPSPLGTISRVFCGHGYTEGLHALEYVMSYERTASSMDDPSVSVEDCERQRIIDINGDGLPDIIQAPLKEGCSVPISYTPSLFRVYFNSGKLNNNNFELDRYIVLSNSTACISWKSNHIDGEIRPMPVLYGNDLPTHPEPNEASFRRDKYTHSDLVDMNGDGLPDRVEVFSNSLFVELNIGSAISSPGSSFWADTEFPYISYERVISTQKTDEHTSYKYYKGTFLRDCNGDGIPDLLSVSDDGNQWYCRENISGQAGRLREIKNEINGRRMVLKYKDNNPLYQDPEPRENFNTRTVLAAVEIDNEMVFSAPLEKRYFYYTDGAEYEGYPNRDKNRFLGWKEIRTSIYPNNATRLVHFDEVSTYDYEYFTPPSTDFRDSKPVSGRLVRKESSYDHVSDGERKLSVDNYQYEDVNYLNSDPSFMYVYPELVWREQYDEEGNCLGDSAPSDECFSYSSKFGQYIYMDVERGMISTRTIRQYGDQYSKFDITKIQEFYDDFGEDYRNYLSEYSLYAGDERAGMLDRHIEDVVYDYVDGRLESQTRTDNNGQSVTNSYTYYNDGSLETIVAPGGITTQLRHSYNRDGNAYVNTTTQPDGSEVKVSYDHFGRVVEEVEVNGYATGYEYDGKGRIIGIKSTRALEEWGDENLIHFDYVQDTSHSQPYWCVLISGAQEGEPIQLTNCYDATGRLIQEKARMEVEGEMKSVVSGKLEFDEYGRIHRKGKNTTREYNPSDLPFVENEMIAPTEFEYNELGKISRITQSDGSFNEFDYKVINNWQETSGNHDVDVNLTLFETKITSSENEETRIYEHVSGETIGVVQVVEDGTKRILSKEIYSPYEYSVMDPLGRISGKKLDFLGRVEWMTTPDAGRFEYIYNDKGLPSQMTHEGLEENGGGTRETFLYYDDIGRPTFVDHEGEDRDIAFSYYPAQDENVELWNRGQLQSVAVGKYESESDQLQDVQLLTEYEYGINSVTKRRALKNLDSATGEIQVDMKYVFDPYGRTTEVHYPDNEIVRYAYDSGGRLFSISGDGDKPYINKIYYNKNGQRTLVENGNDIQTEFKYYEKTNLLKSINVNGQAGEDLLASTYHYNPRKLIETIENDDHTLGYQYDGLGRLSAATGESLNGTWSHSNSYQYDIGDRLQVSSGLDYDGFLSYLPDSAVPDEFVLTKLDGSEDTITKQFTINPWGEMEAVRTLNNDTEVNSRQFDFSSDGTLKSVEDTDTDLRVDYKYDAQGNRVYKKSVSSDGVEKESYYLFALFVQKDDSMNKHISDGTLVVATKTEKDKVRYPIANHIGSTIMNTDEEGKVLSKSVYDPFGNKWSQDGDDATETGERQFTNQVYDSETGLYYFNMRYYDPQLGMFISPDPAMSGSNHYAYANGNPVHFVDLSGLCTDPPCDEKTDPITIAIDPRVIVDFFRGLFGRGGSSGGGSDTNTGPTDEEIAKMEAMEASYAAARSAEDAFDHTLNQLESAIGDQSSGTGIIAILPSTVDQCEGTADCVATMIDVGTFGVGGVFSSIRNTAVLLAAKLAPLTNKVMRIGSRLATRGLRFGTNDLVLGLNRGGSLQQWVMKYGGKTFGKFNIPRGSFDTQIRSALNQAKSIRFNLDGIDLGRISGRLNAFGEPVGGYTNYELFLIKNNPAYLEKAFFYLGGKQVPSPF